jgi:hypothetical protein
MLAKLKTFFTKSPDGKAIEHYAAIFVSATVVAAVTLAQSDSATGLKLSWSLVAGVAVSALKAGYDAIRPALVSLLSKPSKPSKP